MLGQVGFVCVTCLCPGCILNIAEFPSIMKSVVKLFFEAINVRSGLGLVAAVQFLECACVNLSNYS